MRRMILCAAALMSLAAFVPTAQAEEYPWCAFYGGADLGGATNCGFVSFQQCMQTVSGIGGFCDRNNFYRPLVRSRTRG
jgi:hypothetical protein